MRLQYKIIWIDDNIEDYIEMGVVEEFKAYLKNLGFIPTVDCFETGKTAEEKIKIEKYDLILSDYNIEGDEQGDTLIKKIRDGDIFTEILFYSAKPDFENIAKSLYRDRVSFLSLAGDEAMRGFKEKVLWLVDQTISKLQELNSIRGLVMSETSELDTTIEDILSEVMNRKDQTSEQLRKYAIEKVKENNEKRSEIYSKINDMTNVDIIKNRTLFDASKKSRTLNEYFKLTGMSKEEDLVDFHQRYEKDVLMVRNDLAHAKSETIDGVEYLILSRKDGEHPVKYDQDTCIVIRKTLRTYTETLKKVRETIVAN